jgi:hypothetical protein
MVAGTVHKCHKKPEYPTMLIIFIPYDTNPF